MLLRGSPLLDTASRSKQSNKQRLFCKVSISTVRPMVNIVEACDRSKKQYIVLEMIMTQNKLGDNDAAVGIHYVQQHYPAPTEERLSEESLSTT